jgi:hypothetical protein
MCGLASRLGDFCAKESCSERGVTKVTAVDDMLYFVVDKGRAAVMTSMKLYDESSNHFYRRSRRAPPPIAGVAIVVA